MPRVDERAMNISLVKGRRRLASLSQRRVPRAAAIAEQAGIGLMRFVLRLFAQQFVEVLLDDLPYPEVVSAPVGVEGVRG